MRTPWSLLLLLCLLPLVKPAAEEAFSFQGESGTTRFTAGQERTVLTGNARIISGNLEIHADTIELWGKSFRFVACTGRVVVKDKKKNIQLKADTMDYDRTLKTSRFKGLCEMEDTDHGVTVRSGLFDYSEAADKMTMQSGVRIFKGDLVCRSEFAVYDRASDSLELTGLPTVNKKRDVYRAGTIRVNLKTEDVLLDGGVSGTISPEKKKTAGDDAAKAPETPGQPPANPAAAPPGGPTPEAQP